MLCILGSHTLVPISWTCKKQSDAGRRLEGIPALSLWDTVFDVLEPLAGNGDMHKQTQEDEISNGGQEDNRQHWFCSSKRTRILTTGISLFFS